MNALIIENEEETIALIKNFIFELNGNIIFANSAIQGIQKLRNQQFDVIFINDKLIKERNDVNIVSLLKKSHDSCLSKTILMTNDCSKENIKEYMDQGFKSIVTMPVSSYALKEKIQKFTS